MNPSLNSHSTPDPELLRCAICGNSALGETDYMRIYDACYQMLGHRDGERGSESSSGTDSYRLMRSAYSSSSAVTEHRQRETRDKRSDAERSDIALPVEGEIDKPVHPRTALIVGVTDGYRTSVSR